MHIGIMIDPSDVASLAEFKSQIQAAADAGLASAWSAQVFDWDILTALAVVGREVPGIELGTVIVPTYPRHPMMLASQALTAQAAIGDRLTLGIGLSHQVIIEGRYGYAFEKPARHTREYLQVLLPVLRGESVAFEGESEKAEGAVNIRGVKPPSVLVAALGPAMLRIAGELTDGTITAWSGPKTIGDHIVPSITQAAAEAGRPPPRVVASAMVSVTSDEDAARAWVANQRAETRQLPSYRAMLDREGVAGPEDVAIVGDEMTVEREIKRLAGAGATDLIAILFGSAAERTRTMDLLADVSRRAPRRAAA